MKDKPNDAAMMAAAMALLSGAAPSVAAAYRATHQSPRNDAAHIAAAQAKRERRAAKAQTVANKQEGGR